MNEKQLVKLEILKLPQVLGSLVFQLHLGHLVHPVKETITGAVYYPRSFIWMMTPVNRHPRDQKSTSYA